MMVATSDVAILLTPPLAALTILTGVEIWARAVTGWPRSAPRNGLVRLAWAIISAALTRLANAAVAIATALTRAAAWAHGRSRP